MQAHIFVSGQVQGVFFRRSAKIEAEKLEVVGWVRNSNDGSVEVMAQGPKDQLDQFAAWCKKGSLHAKVDRIEVDWSNQQEDFDKFEII